MTDHATTTTGPLRAAADWLASALSMAAALGLVNLAVGVLSALWLLTQLYRFWRFEVHTLRRRPTAAPGTAPAPLHTTEQDHA